MSYITATRAMRRRDRIEDPTGRFPLMQQPGLGDVLPSGSQIMNTYSNIPWYVYAGGPLAVAAYAAARGIQPGSSTSDIAKNAVTGAATAGQIQANVNECLATNARIRAQGGYVAPNADALCVQDVTAAGGATAESVIANTIIPGVTNAALWIAGGLALFALGYYFVVIRR